MTAAIVAIADDVVELLNDGSYAESFEATRVIQPRVKLEDLETLNVMVMGRKTATISEVRGGIQSIVSTVDICVRKKLTTIDAKAEHDVLNEVCEQIRDRLAKNSLPNRDEAFQGSNTDAASDSDWFLEDVENETVFVAVISVNYLGAR